MENRKLLCIGCDWLVPEPAGCELYRSATLAEAARVLRTSHAQIGLIALGSGTPSLSAAERFLRQHWQLHWIAVLPPGALAQAGMAELIAANCHDYLTLPVPQARLLAVLGHAFGMAALRRAHATEAAGSTMIGTGAAIARLRLQVRKIGQATAPVLIWGKSGSGKELAAQAIHAHSARAAGPFVPINCGAIPGALIQSELFGHARGAFTGAARDKIGLIESATGGTVFLDEIADLPRELQANLLRFLQEKTIYRVGSTRSIAVDVRVIAASHVNLQQAVQAGQFREDLYYRLNVLPLTVPPLRERREDVVALAEHFFQLHAAEKPARLKGFSQAAQRALRDHPWPGNVRELVNRVRRALVLAEGRLVQPDDLGLEGGCALAEASQLQDSRSSAERSAIIASLARSGGNVTHAARELAVSRMTLYRQMAKHGIAS